MSRGKRLEIELKPRDRQQLEKWLGGGLQQCAQPCALGLASDGSGEVHTQRSKRASSSITESSVQALELDRVQSCRLVIQSGPAGFGQGQTGSLDANGGMRVPMFNRTPDCERLGIPGRYAGFISSAIS